VAALGSPPTRLTVATSVFCAPLDRARRSRSDDDSDRGYAPARVDHGIELRLDRADEQQGDLLDDAL
jgi:hypothetical protein